MFARIEGLGHKINLTEAAKNYIAEKGYDSNFGARPLKRAIQKYLEDPIAEEILKGELKTGDTILVDYDDDKKDIVVSSSKNEKDDDSSLASDVKNNKKKD